MHYPLRSLREGRWFKLICGASFQHLPAVRNLTLAYALAGVDCVDVSADPAVVSAAQDGLRVAQELIAEAQSRGFGAIARPWLMVSLNDAEDPHFRKATFDPQRCPADCSRPCETICPAQAIIFERVPDRFSGVIDQRCYGCGRCLPVCPIQQITARSYVSTPAAIAPLVLQSGVDALEIHTQVGHFADFRRLWEAVAPWVSQLKLVAVSCPDGEGLIDYLRSLYEVMAPLPCALVWQTDGRPMSGDIGDGATRAAVKLGQKVLAAGLPGFVQLAGGTNRHTVVKLDQQSLLNPQRAGGEAAAIGQYISGVAYGSYARSLLAPLLEELDGSPAVLQMEAIAQGAHRSEIPKLETGDRGGDRLENTPDLLWQAVAAAHALVAPLKFGTQAAPQKAPRPPAPT